MRSRIMPILIIVVGLAFASPLAGALQTATASLGGTVRDQAGALIVGAHVSIRNDATGETRTATTNNEGRFKIDNLPQGAYTLTVEQTGFQLAERKVVVDPKRTNTIDVRLEVVAPREKIEVGAKGAVAPNTEPNYRQLRDDRFFESYEVHDLALKRDAGTLTLRSGRITFLTPVMNRVVKAVFVGEGEFGLTPSIPLERNYLRLITNKDSIVEPFGKLALCFTDDTYNEVKKQSQTAEADQRAKDLLEDFQKRVRHFTERENIEALLLADIFNPKRPGFFSAYIFGKNNEDLRFHLRPRGALAPWLLAPEEVAVVNLDSNREKSGIWYLAHTLNEYKAGGVSSEEDHRIIDAEHYRIETAISGEKLTATAELTFKALGDGDRVLSFGLLPSLRVSRVTLGDREVNFIQEQRKEDGSFYAILPEPIVTGQEYRISIDYQGTRVLADAGGGNFAVGARTSWYPSVNAFNDRATFDLTFKIPKQYALVGVGKLVKEWKEGDFAASQWVSEVPLAVAGFNYGSFKKKELIDPDTKYQIEAYATSEVPDFMRFAPTIAGEAAGDSANLTPTRLIDTAINEAQNSMRLFSRWFGEAPYGRIAITQQPQPNFGQSWPTLVYLPVISFLDSTQRWMMMGRISSRLNEFIAEVTPHEVSHQWWGHIVGWASFHDQWLSEGFADFSAALYLQYTEKNNDKYFKYWEHQRERIIEKNEWGNRANEAGPIWMGLRLNTFKYGGAYFRLVYPKGGFILQMLRSIMYDKKTGDQQFIEMMHDFVKTYSNQNASTEGFKRIVEKHMTPAMDLDENKRMDWFFNEWVYGTEMPSYRLVYSLTPESDGKVLLKFTVTQIGVSEAFKMLVPVYLDFDGKWMRLGEATLVGNGTTPEFKVRLPQKPKRVAVNVFYDVLAADSTSEMQK